LANLSREDLVWRSGRRPHSVQLYESAGNYTFSEHQKALLGIAAAYYNYADRRWLAGSFADKNGIDLKIKGKNLTFYNAEEIYGLPPDIRVVHGCMRPCYDRSADVIRLPERASFIDGGHYLATALHEAAHAAEHPSRLNRPFSERGTIGYAAEELRAEFASVIAQAELGHVPDILNHSAYIKKFYDFVSDNLLLKAIEDAKATAEFIIKNPPKGLFY
jgi:hypothetical protein